MKYEALSFVLSGKLRQEIVKSLTKPMTPAQLATQLRKEDSSVSRTLKELEKKKIIENMFPNQRKGRIYKLTAVGEQVLKSLKQ